MVRLIGNTEGMVGISVTALLEVHFAKSLPEKDLFTKCLSSRVSGTSRENLARSHKSREFVRHTANRTYKVNDILVAL